MIDPPLLPRLHDHVNASARHSDFITDNHACTALSHPWKYEAAAMPQCTKKVHNPTSRNRPKVNAAQAGTLEPLGRNRRSLCPTNAPLQNEVHNPPSRSAQGLAPYKASTMRTLPPSVAVPPTSANDEDLHQHKTASTTGLPCSAPGKR